MFYVVIQNVFLVLINISFYRKLDGEYVISYLMGGFVVDAAKANLRVLSDCEKRKPYFAENGINGVANIGMFFYLSVNSIIHNGFRWWNIVIAIGLLFLLVKCVIYMSLLFVEEILLGVLTRMIWPKQNETYQYSMLWIDGDEDF